MSIQPRLRLVGEARPTHASEAATVALPHPRLVHTALQTLKTSLCMATPGPMPTQVPRCTQVCSALPRVSHPWPVENYDRSAAGPCVSSILYASRSDTGLPASSHLRVTLRTGVAPPTRSSARLCVCVCVIAERRRHKNEIHLRALFCNRRSRKGRRLCYDTYLANTRGYISLAAGSAFVEATRTACKHIRLTSGCGDHDAAMNPLSLRPPR